MHVSFNYNINECWGIVLNTNKIFMYYIFYSTIFQKQLTENFTGIQQSMTNTEY